MDEFREALRYYLRHPFKFMVELLACLSVFFLCYIALLFGYAIGLY